MTIGTFFSGDQPPAAVTDRLRRERSETGVVTETGQPFSATRDAAPRNFPVTVVAQDPSVEGPDGQVLTTVVHIPADALEPGPAGHRLRVVDYDASAPQDGYHTPVDFVLPPRDGGAPDPFVRWRFDEERYRRPARDTIESDPAYHSLNAYAIAAHTLSLFESGLGRRVPWGFDNHQLFIVPRAFAEANAYYSDDDQALFFGYFDDERNGRVYTCLSHDVVAHETTHAILDGLRQRYEEPGLPDQAAFHEAFADIVALLSVCSMEPVIAGLLGKPDAQGRIPKRRVAATSLRRSPLFGLAEQLGGARRGGQGGGLRRSVDLLRSTNWRTLRAFEEPHRRGEILVAAVMQTLLRMWSGRLERLSRGANSITLLQAVEEGAKSASHLLTMMIRAIDYTPPIEIEFEDVLDAVLVSDAEMAPDDDHGYRATLQAAFNHFGIYQPPLAITNLATADRPFIYHTLNYAALRTDQDEMFRFIWQNADLLDIRRRYYTVVDRVQPTVRVGPDGFVVNEIVATYVQSIDGTPAELREHVCDSLLPGETGLDLPEGLSADARVQLWGGGTLIFDQFGRAKYHQFKSLHDWRRQSRRLAYLVRNGLSDRNGNFGFSLGTTRGQRFALAHQAGANLSEVW